MFNFHDEVDVLPDSSSISEEVMKPGDSENYVQICPTIGTTESSIAYSILGPHSVTYPKLYNALTLHVQLSF